MISPAYHAAGRDGTRCSAIAVPVRKDSGKMEREGMIRTIPALAAVALASSVALAAQLLDKQWRAETKTFTRRAARWGSGKISHLP